MLSLFAVLALLLSACQPVMPTPSTSRPHTPREDAPPYGARGPYAVGVRDFVIEPEGDNERQLNVTVWYPTRNPEGAKEMVTYAMGFAPGETPNFTVAGRAILDAPPAAADGPFPLVVQTHAHWTFRQETPYLSEHLASHGLVVISADHEDDWSTLFGPKPWQSEFRRPDEVRRELDFAATLTAPDGALAGMIDLEHVGVSGWSYGGETALVAAGARLQGRVLTYKRIGGLYDRVYESLLNKVASIKEDEWTRGMYFPARWDPNFGDYMTIEELFHYPVNHFNFHLTQISPRPARAADADR